MTSEIEIQDNSAEDLQEQLLDKYTQLSNLRDENIKKGNTELDTETLHGLQEAFLIANHINWLKSLSENLKNTTERYSLSLLEE
jgi:hypothetical protein